MGIVIKGLAIENIKAFWYLERVIERNERVMEEQRLKKDHKDKGR